MSTRDQELAKIAALRKKLDGLKKQSSDSAVSKGDAEELLGKCKALLKEAEEAVEKAAAQVKEAEEEDEGPDKEDLIAENEALKEELTVVMQEKEKLAEQLEAAGEAKGPSDDGGKEKAGVNTDILRKENMQLKKMLEKAKQIETLRRELLEKATKENELHKRLYQEQQELREKVEQEKEEMEKSHAATVESLRVKAEQLEELEAMWAKAGQSPDKAMSEVVPAAMARARTRSSAQGVLGESDEGRGDEKGRTRTFAFGHGNDLDELTELQTQLAEVNQKNEKLIKKIKYLQHSFDNTETLARALYGDLSVDALENPTRTGFLTKQGGSMKNWKHRFFVLKDNFLFYYKKQRDDQPLGVIHLDEYKVLQDNDEEKKHCFQIDTKSRTWHMQADRQVEKDLWMLCISAAVPWYMRGENADLSDSAKEVKLGSSSDSPAKKKRPLSHAFRLSSYLSANSLIASGSSPTGSSPLGEK